MHYRHHGKSNLKVSGLCLDTQMLSRLIQLLTRRKRPLSAPQQAAQLIAAIDAGGIPLNPARINDIARQLGLEVSRRAPLEDTIARIRAALVYLDQCPEQSAPK